jgi:putative FmdB family regulatory protein
MPNYEFKCEKCGKVEEHYLPLGYTTDQHPKHCGEHMDKVWPRPAFKIAGFSEKNGYSNAE